MLMWSSPSSKATMKQVEGESDRKYCDARKQLVQLSRDYLWFRLQDMKMALNKLRVTLNIDMKPTTEKSFYL